MAYQYHSFKKQKFAKSDYCINNHQVSEKLPINRISINCVLSFRPKTSLARELPITVLKW